MSPICRTCLKLDETESCTYASLNSVVPESDCLSLRDKLLACVPELSINVVPDPSICNSCASALQVMYQFWTLCLQTEETIRNYVQKNALSISSVDLHDLVEFEQAGLAQVTENVASIEVECESVEVECSSPIEMNIEPDLIEYLLPVVPPEKDCTEQRVKEEVNEVDGDDISLEYFENYSVQNEEIIEVIIKSEDTEENLENESQNNSHVCHKCGQCFTSQASLNRHASVHVTSKNKWNGPKKIKKNTLPLKRVNEHLSRENAKKNPHMCDVCGKCFLKKATLTTHMNVHKGVKLYKCDVCNKQFNFKNNLQRHALMHEGGTQKRFKCNICEKLFTRKEHLKKHMISHTDDMSYQCTLCNKMFKYKSSLRGHLKYHNGEKRFRCEICGNGFIRRDNLHVHIRTVHADETPIECDICKEEFVEKCSYEEHQKIHTGRKYYKCKTCDKLCQTKQSLQTHSNTHLREKPYKCSFCGHTFSQRGTLTYHIRTHTGEKPYTCFVCERSFTQKATLRSHVQRHRRSSGVLVKDEDIDVEENALDIC